MSSGIISLVWLLSWASGGVTQDMREIYRTTDTSGRVKIYRVAEDRLLATKKWSPESEEPPLSVSAAVKVALKRLGTRQAGGFRVVGVELSASGGQEWRWFYRVACYDLATARAPQGPEMVDVIVLMDGSVVDPSPGPASR